MDSLVFFRSEAVSEELFRIYLKSEACLFKTSSMLSTSSMAFLIYESLAFATTLILDLIRLFLRI